MIRRAFHLMRRNPIGTFVSALCLGIWSTIAVNASLLQDGRHPAPLLDRADHWSDTVTALPKPKPERWSSRVEPGRLNEEVELRARQAEQALIRELQATLAERGFYTGPADGLEGPLTQSAIRAYEETAGLEATGRASAALLAHLRLSAIEAAPLPPETPEQAEMEFADWTGEGATDLPSMASLSEGSQDSDEATGQGSIAALIETTGSLAPEVRSDPQVRVVQEVLADLGYAPGRIDGQLGASTRGAIRRFEADRGLPESGEISERLLRELTAVSGLPLG